MRLAADATLLPCNGFTPSLGVERSGLSRKLLPRKSHALHVFPGCPTETLKWFGKSLVDEKSKEPSDLLQDLRTRECLGGCLRANVAKA